MDAPPDSLAQRIETANAPATGPQPPVTVNPARPPPLDYGRRVRPKRTALDWLLGRLGRIPTTGLVLKHDGNAEIVDVEGRFTKTPSGLALVRSEARIWLDRPIPAGWLTLWAQGHPEPLALEPDVAPPPGPDSNASTPRVRLRVRPLTMETLEHLLGPIPPRVVFGALQGRKDGFSLPSWWMIAALVLGAVAAGYLWIKKNGGL